MVGGLALDILTRIINVHWAGGGTVFVYGTLTDNAIYYVSVKDADTKPEQRTIVAPGPGNPDFGLSAYGSSYHLVVENKDKPNEKKTPTFLVCGNKASLIDAVDDVGNPIRLTVFHTLIYRSKDGLNWEIVRESSGEPTWADHDAGANPVALVWDPDKSAFFYDQNHVLTDQIFQSSNGTGWSMVSSTPTEGDPDYKSEFLTHCARNDCVDEFGQHVPDGVMANGQVAITAKPVKPPIINYAQGTTSIGVASGDPQETWGSDKVEITVTKLVDAEPVVTKTTVAIPGLKKVFCVAGAGGFLMAGGSPDLNGDTGAVVLSLDQGTTWKVLATRASSVTTMVAAPAGDLGAAS
jgi:hypothetical protein